MTTGDERVQRVGPSGTLAAALEGQTVTVGDQPWRIAIGGVERDDRGDTDVRLRIEGPYNRVRDGRVTLTPAGLERPVPEILPAILRRVAEWLPHSDAADEFRFVVAAAEE